MKQSDIESLLVFSLELCEIFFLSSAYLNHDSSVVSTKILGRLHQ